MNATYLNDSCLDFAETCRANRFGARDHVVDTALLRMFDSFVFNVTRISPAQLSYRLVVWSVRLKRKEKAENLK
jgi:hypothetical protein